MEEKIEKFLFLVFLIISDNDGFPLQPHDFETMFSINLQI